MRKYYLDNLRWMTILLVVIYHVIYMYNGIVRDGVIGSEHSVALFDGMQYVLYPWFMVLLFMIAGMCSRYYLEDHSARDFLKNRTRKLLIPSTAGLLVFGWTQGYVNMSIAHAFETFPSNIPTPVFYLIMVVSGTGVLWFIQVLWINSLLLFFIRKFEKGRLYSKTINAGVISFFICGVLFYLAGQVLNTPIVAVYRFGIYGYTFFLGYFVLAHEEIINKLSKVAWVLFDIAVLLAGGYLYIYYGENYATMPTAGSLPAAAYGYMMSLAMLGLGYKYLNTSNKWTCFMNQRSYGIYIFHYLPLSLTALLLEKTGSIPPAIKYIAVFVMAFIGSIGLYEIIQRIPVLRLLILGIKKEHKDVQ